MTRHGWNPDGSFTHALTQAIARVQGPSASESTPCTCPHPYLSDPDFHRSVTPDSPCVA